MEWLGIGLAGLVVLAAVIVAAELLARAYQRSRGANYIWAPYSQIQLEMDLNSMPGFEKVVLMSFNRDGERGDEPPRDWTDTYRVLVVGGSAAEGYSIGQSRTWPAQIQSRLREPQNLQALGVGNVHVGNAARSFALAEVVAVIVRGILHRYQRLDLMLIMLGASDLLQWLEKGAPATIKPGQYKVERIFAVQSLGRYGWRSRQTALRQIAAHLNEKWRRPVQRKYQVGRNMDRLRASRANAKHMIDQVPDPTPMLQHFENNFRDILRIAKAKAKRVIVVRQPWFEKDFDQREEASMWHFNRGQVHAGPVDTYYSHRVAIDLMHRVDATQSAIAREMGVEQVDLMPHLERSLDTYYDFYHFTPKGCDAVATVVTEAILRPVAGQPAASADVADAATVKQGA